MANQIPLKLTGTPQPARFAAGDTVAITYLDAAPKTTQFLTLAADSGLDNERVFTPGPNLRGTDAGAGAAYTLNTGLGASRYLLEDHFIAVYGNTANGLMGSEGFVAINTQVSGTSTFGFGQTTALVDANHPGVVLLRVTNAAAASGIYTYRGAPVYPEAINRMVCIVKGAVGTANGGVRFGLARNVAAAGETGEGIYWSFDSATSATAWRTVTRDGSSITDNTTGVDSATEITYDTTNWKQFEIRRNGSNWEFWANLGTSAPTLQFTHSTNLITGVAAYPFFSVESTTGSSSDFGASIDYMGFETIALTSQYS